MVSIARDWAILLPSIQELHDAGHNLNDACTMAGVTYSAYCAALRREATAALNPIPADAPPQYTHSRAKRIAECWSHHTPAMIGSEMHLKPAVVVGIARYLGLVELPVKETERKCLGYCGRMFKSKRPKSVHRICDACVELHRKTA